MKFFCSPSSQLCFLSLYIYTYYIYIKASADGYGIAVSALDIQKNAHLILHGYGQV